jgi:hypothetical protein
VVAALSRATVSVNEEVGEIMTEDLRQFKARVKDLSQEEQRAAFSSEEFRNLIYPKGGARAAQDCKGHCMNHCRSHCKSHCVSHPKPQPILE